MASLPVNVLHVDTGVEWRGGQQQAAYLLEALQCAGHRTALVCRPEAPLRDFCRGRGISCFPVTMRGELDIIGAFRVAQLCRKAGFDILHLHSAHAHAIGLLTKLFQPSLRLVAARRVDFHIRQHFLSRWKYKTASLDRIVCISEAIRSVLISDGIPADKLTVIHSGIDVDRFKNTPIPKGLRTKLGIPEDHLIVGTVAAMVDHKDYPTLLRAARYVLERCSNVTFCAVGDGPEKTATIRLARSLQLGDRFVFAGSQPDVGSHLSIFDVFVLSSKMEGLGTSLLDAQALGIPVVACQAGGIPEAVQDERTGLLVPAEDPEALGDAILRLARDAKLRSRLAVGGRQSVSAFDIRLTVEKNIALYREILAS
jgi:glycosyltransferase involved in cell wall biosynthesis